VLYAIATIKAPVPSQVNGRYGLGSSEMALLRLSVAGPFLLIWLAGVYALTRFSHYTQLLNSSAETSGFKKITKGLWFLLIVIVVPQFINLITSYNPESLEMQKSIVIFRNYFNIALYLAGFIYIYRASRDLMSLQSVKKSKYMWGFLILIFVLSSLYIFSIFSNDYRGISNDALIKPTYYLSDLLIITTIVIPYILIWILGTMAFVNIFTFSKNVQGIIYKKSFASVAYGLGSIIFLSICLQFLSQLSAYFGRAGLGIILLIVYSVLIAIAIAYLFIAKGARALTDIEEI